MGIILGSKNFHDSEKYSGLHRVEVADQESASMIMRSAIRFMAMRGWVDARRLKGWKLIVRDRICRRCGSCSAATRTININAPRGMNVATILHEVAHLKFYNHSAGFRNIEKNLFTAWGNEIDFTERGEI